MHVIIVGGGTPVQLPLPKTADYICIGFGNTILSVHTNFTLKNRREIHFLDLFLILPSDLSQWII
jgi:hypothetical protein